MVVPVDEEIRRAEQPNPAPAAQEAEAAPRPEETQRMRLEREAGDLAAASLAELETVGTTARRGRTLEWQQCQRHAKPVEGA